MVGFPDLLSVIADVTDSYWIRRHRAALIAFRFVAVFATTPLRYTASCGFAGTFTVARHCRRAATVIQLRVTFSQRTD